ncbi:MAG TPA: bifunctional glutamate N-acetyltransferase/amino-acid acetyltransferase ArgJ [Longimicrobiales bacterium]|nr:bifunctional glutamate N-acetyltransferase/amino-acid acetyltransferase ArgJ [Longimicrobiales bacterium]
MIDFDEPPRFPRGFVCAARNCGLKERGPDLTLFFSRRPATASAVFTRNLFPGAPVIVGRERIRAGRLRGIVVNSKVSNVGTGDLGIRNAERMAAAAAQELGVTPQEIIMSSTGVIGVPLPIDKIERGIAGMAADLQDDPLVGAQGMMTTDTRPKAVSCAVDGAVITMVAKGSGMIEPNLATMLVYIFTDAEFPAAQLQTMLVPAVDVSFNMLSVDTDTSTSDTCVLMANGAAGPVDRARFAAALEAACIRMAELLARDGEGATKLLRGIVRGALNQAEARRIAKSIVNSPLVKTMAYGADPNVGRILMAVGKCLDCTIVPGRMNATINGTLVIRGGLKAEFDEPDLRRRLAGDPVNIEVDLQVGEANATAFGCDLTEGYIKENAAYYSS